MCIFSAPKMPAVPQAASFQPAQNPKDLTNGSKSALDATKKRGLWASLFTSPQGISMAPITTGTMGGKTGSTGG